VRPPLPRSRIPRTAVLPTDTDTIHTAVHESVEPGSTLHTDEHGAYRGLSSAFDHASVNHSAGEYVRDGVSTNSIESVWAVLKRGIYGTYHHVSPKHLPRYVDEFAFRLNQGNVNRHTLDRLDSFVDGVAGKRLSYKSLIA
jgi:ISXO2 transposase-like protein